MKYKTDNEKLVEAWNKAIDNMKKAIAPKDKKHDIDCVDEWGNSQAIDRDADIDEHEQYEEERTYSEERIAMAEESISLNHFE